jgi:deoxyribodipyrimidine photolyase-related protein
MRNRVRVLGDRFDRACAAGDGFEPRHDLGFMAEVAHEYTKVWSSKLRIAMFLAAMHRSAAELETAEYPLLYPRVDASDGIRTLGEAIAAVVRTLRPERIVCVEPGEFGVRAELRTLARRLGIAFDECPDRNFLASHEQFAAHARRRTQLRREYFYREMRRSQRVLMDGDLAPGGEWNYASANRKAFGRIGPPQLGEGAQFMPDAITREALADVERCSPGRPATLEAFD